MREFTTITDLTNHLSETLDLDRQATEVAIRQHQGLFSNYGRIPAIELAALSRAVYEEVTGDTYPDDWARQDAEQIAEQSR